LGNQEVNPAKSIPPSVRRGHDRGGRSRRLDVDAKFLQKFNIIVHAVKRQAGSRPGRATAAA